MSATVPGVTVRRATARPLDVRRTSRRCRAAWPLSILFLGYPLWWALGVVEIAFFVSAACMAWVLFRRGAVVTPRGFGVWLVFLGTVALSGAVLDAQAPSAVDGGEGSVLTFGYRLLWYATVTVPLLYVGNLARDELPAERVCSLLGYMFVVTAAGGVLGLAAPTLEFTSPVEAVLPGGLANNPFVQSLVHPSTADVQSVLGYEQARPRAPFAYANTWGASFSMFLPFFLYSWCRRGCGWRRVAALPILVGGAVAAIYSLNRGLWLVLALGFAYALVQYVRLRGVRALPGAVAISVVVMAVALLSPLTDMVQERLDNPHSNDRRSQLASVTAQAVLTASPVIGFGNTRDVQGSFASIAGGSSADCKACGVPPLGTQGHAWGVLFAQGLVGAASFGAFFCYRLIRHLRSRHPMSVLGVAVLLAFLVEIWVYDTLGSPLFTVMIALGLMWRADRREAT